MRLGHKNVLGGANGIGVDATVDAFSEGMRYRETVERFSTAEDFVSHFEGQAWVAELNAALRRLIEPNRRVFGMGSGLGEHEILLSRAGYSVASSDVVDTNSFGMGVLFPSHEFFIFDTFRDTLPFHVDTLLVTGMDSYFDGPKFEQLIASLARLLQDAQRSTQADYVPELIFTCRYPNNLATWLVDVVVLPFECALLNFRAFVRRKPERWHRKAHGYRRSTREVIDEATRWGLMLKAVDFAGIGVEAQRSFLVARSNLLRQWLSNWDRRGVLSNCRILVFRAGPL